MDHFQRSLLNYFTLQPLDRAAHLRIDEDWLQAQHTDKHSRFYLLHNDRVITYRNRPLCIGFDRLNLLDSNDFRALFLGTQNRKTCFAVNLADPRLIESQYQSVQTHSLRDLADCIDMETASILAYGQLLNRWHRTNRFCRRCGQAYMPAQGGHVLKCSSDSCKHIEFPRINPAVIMRVTCGDHILLGRQPSWPKNRYSVLAGFVETGESLEHAVKREIKEEAGIDVEQIYYHSSQPWPFPNSLMIGYTAQATSMDLDIENDDLETAIWLNADELTQCMDAKSVILSPPISISHRLIEDWFMEQTGRSIKEWQQIKPEHIVSENE